MKANTRLGMTNVNGWAKRLTHPGGAIAVWVVLIVLYFASLVPASFPERVANALFPHANAAVQVFHDAAKTRFDFSRYHAVLPH
jgi:hypothetical protein